MEYKCQGPIDKATVEDTIENYGFQIVGILPSEEHEPFAYTVGLREEGLPDVILSGIGEPEKVHNLIWNCVKFMRKNKEGFYGVTNELANIPLLIARCSGEPAKDLYEERVGIAMQYYGEETPFVQIIWPDTEGRYPFHQGYNYEEFEQAIFVSELESKIIH